MDGWQGFSDRELRNLRQGTGRRPVSELASVRGAKTGGGLASRGGHVNKPQPAQFRKPSPIRGRDGRRQGYGSTSSPPASDNLSHEAFFQPPSPLSTSRTPTVVSVNSKSQAETNPQYPASISKDLRQQAEVPNPHGGKKSNGSDEGLTGPSPPLPVRLAGVEAEPQCGITTQQSGGNSTVDPDISLTESPRVTLEELQRQQREIEAENKKRKALLEQALQERYKRSEVEAKTLEGVKKELVKLDNQVSRDISMLRDKIEEANRLYNSARKRYELAEAEFVASKMELHRSSEMKELLSEHLCTVIQQNEVRKAKKLAELLHALNIETSDSLTSTTTTIVPALFQKTPTPGLEIWPRGPSKQESLKATFISKGEVNEGAGEPKFGSEQEADQAISVTASKTEGTGESTSELSSGDVETISQTKPCTVASQGFQVNQSRAEGTAHIEPRLPKIAASCNENSTACPDGDAPVESVASDINGKVSSESLHQQDSTSRTNPNQPSQNPCDSELRHQNSE